MNTEFKTTTINDFLDNFAGREGHEGYDDTRPIKIAECNRDFVWSYEMQQGFIKSILEGYPIPAMCIANGKIVDGGNRSTTLWLFRNNEFKVQPTGMTEEIDYNTMCNNWRSLTRRWDSAVIPQQVIMNATPDQFSQIYENLNKGINLTTGQLLQNRKHRPLVAMAESMITHTSNPIFPYRDLLHKAWKSTFKRTKSRNELADAFQILVGAECGPAHFHTSFPKHISRIMRSSEPIMDNLKMILELFVSCDEENLVDKKKKSTVFKKFIGAVIHDFHTMTRLQWSDKWTQFIDDAYNRINPTNFKKLTEVGTMRALNSTRIEAISKNIEKYLRGELLIDSDSDSDFDSDTDESI
jgi:hypothetical protein